MSTNQSIHAISVALALDDTSLEAGLRRASSTFSGHIDKMIQGMSVSGAEQSAILSAMSDRIAAGMSEAGKLGASLIRARERDLRAAQEQEQFEERVADDKRNRIYNEIEALSKVADYRKQMVRWELEHIRTVNEAAAKAARDPSISKENSAAMRFLGGGKSPSQVATQEAEQLALLTKARERDLKAAQQNQAFLERAQNDRMQRVRNEIALTENLNKSRTSDNERQQAQANTLLRQAETVQERYNRRLAELNMLRATENIRTKQAMLTEAQYTRLKTQLIIQTIRQQQVTKDLTQTFTAGMGGMTGVMTQASFAVEDFTQVMMMGGGLNMALMSASNNISMMVRALIPATTLMGTIAGATVPLLLVGLGMLAYKFMQAKDPLEKLNEELERLKDNTQRDIRLGSLYDFEDFIRKIKSAQDAMNALAEAEIERRRALLESRLAQNDAKASLDAFIMSIEEARKLTSVSTASEEFEYYQMAFEAYQKAYKDLMDSNMKTEQDARTALNEYLSEISQYPTVFKDQIERLRRALSDGSSSALDLFKELEKQNARLFDAEQKREEAKKRAVELAREELRLRQQEQLLMMRMTEEEKKKYDLAKEQADFMGMNPMDVVSTGMNPMGAIGAAASMAAGVQFLQAKADQIQKDLENTTQPGVQGALEKDAFKAQADAIQQAVQAANKKPDPVQQAQLHQLELINKALGRNPVILQGIP